MHITMPGTSHPVPGAREQLPAQGRQIVDRDRERKNHHPGKDGGAGEGTRTPDPIITNDVLYQLSYTGTVGGAHLACPRTDV